METEVLISNEFHGFLKFHFKTIDDGQFVFRKKTRKKPFPITTIKKKRCSFLRKHSEVN